MNNWLVLCSLLLLVSAEEGCSNEAGEFRRTQHLLAENQQAMQRSLDYDVRIKLCESSVQSLQQFVESYPHGDSIGTARSLLNLWSVKHDETAREKASLMSRLYLLLKGKALQEARHQHPLSKSPEDVVLQNREEWKQGSLIVVRDIYSVTMHEASKAEILIKMKVSVSGSVSMETRRVFVDDAVNITE